MTPEAGETDRGSEAGGLGGGGDTGEGANETAVGEGIEGVEREPLAVTPGGVEPASEEGEVFGPFADGNSGRGEGLCDFAEAAVERDHGAGRFWGDAEEDGREPGGIEEESKFDVSGEGARGDGDTAEVGGFGDEVVAELEQLLDALDAGVVALGVFEVEIAGGAVAGGTNGSQKRFAGGVDELREAGDFGAVFSGGHDFLARAKTTSHFAVNATGVVRVGSEVFLAAPDLEEVEHFGFETFGGGASTEGAIVDGLRGGETGGYLGSGELVGEEELDISGEAKAGEADVLAGEVGASGLVEGEEGGESRWGENIFDTGGEVVQIEEAGGGGWGVEKALETATEACGATEVGGSVSGVNDEDRGSIGEFIEGERRSEEGGLHAGSVLPVQDAEPGFGGGGRVGADAQVLAHVSGLAHAGEGEGDAWGGAGELEGEFGVGPGFVPPGTEVAGDAVDESSLMKCGTGDDGDAGAGGDFENINGFTVQQDVRESESLGHAQVERELEEAEVVVAAACLAREFEDPGEREAAGLTGFKAKSGPGGGAVEADVVGGAELLKAGESVEETFLELTEGNVGKLGFGVVEVEDIEGVEAEVGAGAGDLVSEEIWVETVRIAGDVGGMKVGGDGAGGEKAGLGGDEDFITGGEIFGKGAAEGFAEVLFGAGVAIVDCGVEGIDTAPESGKDRVDIAGAGGLVGFAKIGTEADRGHGAGGGGPVERLGREGGVPGGEAGGAFGVEKAGGHENDCSDLGEVRGWRWCCARCASSASTLENVLRHDGAGTRGVIAGIHEEDVENQQR